MTYDSGEHVKEVFAHFGRAYYLAGVFEIALANALLYLDFLRDQKVKIQRAGPKNFDRPSYEAEFDQFMKKQHAKTVGNLIKRVHELTDMDEPLKAVIATAKVRRDFLAHHFFREHAEDFARRGGRDRMLAELYHAQQLFESAARKIADYLNPIGEQVGMPPALVEAYTKKYLQSFEAEEHPQQHLAKERIERDRERREQARVLGVPDDA
jgi:hypothetical protein